MQISFNSTLVRLKAGRSGLTPKELLKFQPSTLVRLKDSPHVGSPVVSEKFNSTLVRLKDGEENIDLSHLNSFQFHTGSIKRTCDSKPFMPLTALCFNSTLVRLKARTINKKYYTKPALFLQGENHLLVQKSSTSGYAKINGSVDDSYVVIVFKSIIVGQKRCFMD